MEERPKSPTADALPNVTTTENKSIRLPALLNFAANILTGLALANVGHTDRAVSDVIVYVWTALYLTVCLAGLTTVPRSTNALGHAWSETAGTVLACMNGAFIGYASNQFNGQDTEGGLYVIFALLVLSSFVAATTHLMQRWRLVTFLCFAWVPFIERLLSPDVSYRPKALLYCGIALFVIVLVSVALYHLFSVLLEERIEQDQSARELQQKQTALVKAHDDQHIFFLAATHDIRQPLQAVSAYAVALEQNVKTLPAAQSTNIMVILEKLLDSTGTLSHLIDETLRFAKIAAGDEKPRLTIVNVQDIVDHLRIEFGEQAKQKNLELTISDYDILLLTDPAILQRVLANLIYNSIRHTSRGRILVTFRRRSGQCLIEVRDTGKGIPPNELGLVFQTFYQGNNNVNAIGSQRGYGLGLSIVKRLCLQLGTDVELRSVVGKGTCVGFYIPLASNQFTDIVPIFDPAPRTQHNLTGVTVGIVEDDDSIRSAWTTVLSNARANVIAAASGNELAYRLTSSDQLDCLVADLHLAGELGTDVITFFKRQFPSMTSIIVTGDANEDTLRKLRQEGFHIQSKPIDPYVLMHRIFESVAQARRAGRINSPST